MKNITFLILLVLCASTQVLAQSVRLRTDIDLAVSGTTSSGANSISLNVVKPSGEATAETGPAIVYVPIENSVTDSHLYYFNAKAGVPTSLFNTGVTSDVVNVPLRIITLNSDLYLYAAVKDTTDSNKFKVIKQYSTSPMTQGQTYDVAFPLAPANICATLVSDCTYLAANSNSPTEKSFIVYFFLSSASSYGVNQEVTIASAPLNNGIYFNFYMSNRVYPDSSLRITINSVRAGDKRAILSYTGSGTLSTDYAKAVKVFKHSALPTATNSPIGDSGYTGALLAEDFVYLQNSEVTVSGLTNSEEAILSVVFLDKFNFVTTLSKEVSATPLEIQELLKKNACFLLTAGFGEDHYIIDYFRHFRDTILSKSYLGRAFISVYYETAPKYALMIYHNETIRAVIRGFAYALYFIMNFYIVVLLGFVGAGAFIVYRKRNKLRQAV